MMLYHRFTDMCVYNIYIYILLRNICDLQCHEKIDLIQFSADLNGLSIHNPKWGPK